MRDETITLACGCKIGRTKTGMWVYDYICDIHVELVRLDGKYSYEKACELTNRLNKMSVVTCKDCKKSWAIDSNTPLNLLSLRGTIEPGHCWNFTDKEYDLRHPTKEDCEDYEYEHFNYNK